MKLTICRGLLLIISGACLSVVNSRGQASLRVGYAQFELEQESAIPVMSALFRLENSQNILVSEAGVRAVHPIRKGRIFVQEDAQRQTGVAIVNLSDQSQNLHLVLRDLMGEMRAEGDEVLSAGEHTALFVNELFQDANLPQNFQGSLTFEVSGGEPHLAAVTLRQSFNAQNEPVFTTLPVADLSNSVEDEESPQSVIFPQLGSGGGVSSQIVLINRSSQAVSGTLQFFASDGQPLQLRMEGVIGAEFPLDIPSDGVFFAQPESPDPLNLRVGYAVVTIAEGVVPAGTVIFRFVDNQNVAISEAGVGAVPGIRRVRIPVDTIGTRTALAASSPGNPENRLEFDLLDSNGNVISSTSESLPANGHNARFADSLFDLPDHFSGQMEIRSQFPIAPITLRFSTNQRQQPIVTTLPVADLDNPGEKTVGQGPDQSMLVIPQLAFGVSQPGDFSTLLLALASETETAVLGHLAFRTGKGEPWVMERLSDRLQFGVGGGERGDLPLKSAAPALIIEKGESTSKLITPEGGSIQLENHRGDVVTLEIPPRALRQEVTVTVTELTRAPGGLSVGNVFPGIQLEPEDLVFFKPARLEVQLAEPLSNPQSAVLSWVAGSSAFVPIGNQFVLEDVIAGEIWHFSTYSGDQLTLSEALWWADLLVLEKTRQELAEMFQQKGKALPPAFMLDQAMLEFLTAINDASAIATLAKMQDVLGAEASADFLGFIEQAALRFLQSAIPEEPCGNYHSLLRDLAETVALVGDPDLDSLFADRVKTLDEQCITIDLTGTWQVTSVDPSEVCRLVRGCQSGNCRWTESEEDTVDLIDIGQFGSDFLISITDAPEFGFYAGSLQATGLSIAPYSFSAEVRSSSDTPDCQIFFDTAAQGIGFGAPICASGTNCTPLVCQETLRVQGDVDDSGTAFVGIEVWDFIASVRENTGANAGKTFRYRCKGSTGIVGQKQ